jgi:hypothetical protein
MGPNYFKYNGVCDAGAIKEKHLAKIFKEEEKKKTLMSAPVEKEDNSNEFLTQWEKEMKMLEDFLENLEPEDGFQERVMHIVVEDHLIELLKNFSSGVEQEMTAALEPPVEEEENKKDFSKLYEEL